MARENYSERDRNGFFAECDIESVGLSEFGYEVRMKSQDDSIYLP